MLAPSAAHKRSMPASQAAAGSELSAVLAAPGLPSSLPASSWNHDMHTRRGAKQKQKWTYVFCFEREPLPRDVLFLSFTGRRERKAVV